MESDEEAGDNVMRRGAEPEDGGGVGGGSKQRRERDSERGGREGMLKRRRRAQGVCIWHWEAGKDSVGQAGRTCVFVFD